MNTSTTTRTHPTTGSSSQWATLRERIRAHRHLRVTHARLMRELDAYRTRAELDDPFAAVDRSDHPDAAITRAALHAKLRTTQPIAIL